MEESEYKEILKIISDAEGIPVCIQALWDGDTSGWFLVLSAVIKKGVENYDALYLTKISKGGDIRLFKGEVPPWPEAVVGNEVGNKLARELEVDFFFPSPEEPDDDCPTWLNRKSAINCVGCNKLIIPSWSKYQRLAGLEYSNEYPKRGNESIDFLERFEYTIIYPVTVHKLTI